MKNYLSELNKSQKKAVTFNGKHLLVLAGAGTGKTKTIIARAAYLISNGVLPKEIQILTFTKRAAMEIVTRVKASLTEESKNVNGSTFHSWCNELITRYPFIFGTESYTTIDRDDQNSIMKISCGKNEKEFNKLKIILQWEKKKNVIREFVELYSFARNTKRNLTDTLILKLFDNKKDKETDKKIKKTKSSFEKIFRGYEDKKKERKYLDYDDLISVVAVELIKNKKAREIIGKSYKHILVDEMQDTNPLQWDLLNPFQDVCHLYCVGDDAQSIYAFRGADFKNVHSFKERVSNSTIYKLEDNYRSTQEILDISNWLLKESPIKYNKNLKAVRGKGKVPKIIICQNEWDEAEFITDKILKNITKKNKNYGDHLILSRSSYYSRTLQALCIQKKIPHKVFGGFGFMESAHLKDLISVLRIANNPSDELAWVRFLGIWEGIGPKTTSKYIEKIFKFNTIEKCIQWFNDLSSEKNARNISDILKVVVDNKDNIRNAVEQSYKLMQKRLSENYSENWEKRKPDFPILIILASKFSSFGEFITECVLDNSASINNSPFLKQGSKRKEKIKDGVIISTIHSAKGLETDTCFILDVSPKVHPSVRSLGSEDEIEEDRRVLYVALTRAKNELILTRNIISINTSEDSYYFLNKFPEDLAKQKLPKKKKFYDVILDSKEKKDFDSTSIGMDFS